MSDKNKITKLESKRNELVRSIYTCAHHKKKIINLVQELSSQHERDRISHREYSERLFNALDKRTPEHWINYYDEKIRDYNNQLNVISEEIKREDYLLNEVSYGSFERTLTLPEGVKADNVHASYKNGILEVTMPAEKAALPRKVTEEVEGAKEEKTKRVA